MAAQKNTRGGNADAKSGTTSAQSGSETTRSEAAGQATGDELVINYAIDAPRERVWRAWTEPEEAKKWWGPKNFTAPEIKVDLREGGRYLFCMRSPDGKDFWSTGVYREIKKPERLVMTDSFADENGKVVPGSHYGMNNMPLEMLVTVTLEEENGKTKMTLRHQGMPAGEMMNSARQGWTESFEKLEEAVRQGRSA